MGKVIATLAVIILVSIAYRALTGGDGSDDVSNAGCETTLCCSDCDIISVSRIIVDYYFPSIGQIKTLSLKIHGYRTAVQFPHLTAAPRNLT